MVIEKEIVPLLEWLLPTVNSFGALLTFAIILAILTVVSLFVAYVRMAFLLGPAEGFYAVAKGVKRAIISDFPNTQLRRVLAMARLAVQESVRRRVLIVFAVFAIVLLFAGWFLDTQSDHPARLYLSFVLTATELLILILAVLLSAFSLPTDIKSKTIHTVVTKPVRSSEIVLGRIFGFCAVNTVILILMGIVSYMFVVRGLSHRHALEGEDLRSVAASGDRPAGLEGETSFDSYHRHDVRTSSDGLLEAERRMDHTHVISQDGEAYLVGSASDALIARVPVYGKLRFIDRTGQPGRGISVGKEWTYRKYIEGGSLAAAIWTFVAPSPEQYPERIPLEMSLSVFRTYKGEITRGILGSITIKNPQTGLSSEPIPFTATEFVTSTNFVPRKLKALDPDGTLRDIDLYEDLVDENGLMEIWVQCSERAQYYGMAQADVYIRGQDGLFEWNFAKAYMGIWLQMLILTCFGVTFSTFLSGPVAMFATFTAYSIGLFKDFIIAVATGEQVGGGPLEAFIKILTQKTISLELDMGPVMDRVVPAIDAALMLFLWLAAMIFPDYESFNTSGFVAYGFNIDGNLLAQHFLIAAAFAFVLSIYGYFFLRTREIAA